jgi:beta-galactosidase
MAGNQVAVANTPTLTIPTTTLAQNGQSVTVAINSNFGDVTSTPVTLTEDAAAGVGITTQPAAQTAVVGQTATFTVAATGSPQLNYQWFQGGSQVLTGPQPSYTTPAPTTAGTSSVYVIVSNPVNHVQSAMATLTINAPVPVSIITPPSNQMIATGLTVQFSPTVAGSAPYTYQWQFTPMGGTAAILMSGTTRSNIIPSPSFSMTAANVGAYAVTVTTLPPLRSRAPRLN